MLHLCYVGHNCFPTEVQFRWGTACIFAGMRYSFVLNLLCRLLLNAVTSFILFTFYKEHVFYAEL